MPLRSVKMYRFIFGFQRRVWWPKWTPLSRSCFMVTTGAMFEDSSLMCASAARLQLATATRLGYFLASADLRSSLHTKPPYRAVGLSAGEPSDATRARLARQADTRDVALYVPVRHVA